MLVQRIADTNRPKGRRLRRLAAGLAALLALLLATAISTDAAVAAPTSPSPSTSESPGQPPTGTTAPGKPSPNAVAWSIQGASKHKVDTRPTFTYQDFKPGTAREDFVAVDNFSSKPLDLTVYPSDAFNTETGGFDVLTAAQKNVDVGSWIRLAKTAVRVPARSTVIIPFTIAAPRNATPGFHVGGIVASSSSTALDSKGNNVRVDRRVGMRIYLQVSGPLHPTLTVKNMSVNFHGGWSPDRPGSATVSYTVANTGNVPLQAKQTLGTEGLFGVFSKTTKAADVPLLLPGNSIKLTSKLSDIWPGGRLRVKVDLAPYTSIVTLASTPAHGTGQTSVWAMPWTWLIALLVVLAIVALYVRRWRKRRKAAKAPKDAAKDGAKGASGDTTGDGSREESKEGSKDASAGSAAGVKDGSKPAKATTVSESAPAAEPEVQAHAAAEASDAPEADSGPEAEAKADSDGGTGPDSDPDSAEKAAPSA